MAVPIAAKVGLKIATSKTGRKIIMSIIGVVLLVPILLVILVSSLVPEINFDSTTLTISPVISDTFIVSQEYGATNGGELFYEVHKGIDFAEAGEVAIMSVTEGKVISTKNNCLVGDNLCGGGFGNYVLVEYENDDEIYNIYYAHLKAVNIETGTEIKKFTPIGYMGNTGYSTGQHLHFEVRTNGNSIDPNIILGDVNLNANLFSSEFICLIVSNCESENEFYTAENTYLENQFINSKMNLINTQDDDPDTCLSNGVGC